MYDRKGRLSGRSVVARDITAQRQIEAQVRQQQRELSAMEERERIGRELHDGLGQMMGYVNVQAQAALALLAQDRTVEANATLERLAQIAQDGHANVREYILGIKTTAEPAADFFTALEKYLREFKQHYGIETRVSLPEDLADSPFAPAVEAQLLRIIQESLTNVRKHAGVDVARITFLPDTNQACVIVEDDGCGFVPHPLPGLSEERGCFGLDIMRERAEEVGGSLCIRSAPGQGTRVITWMPLSRALSPGPEIKGAEGGPLRVLLVDDHPLFLEGLRNLLTARGVQVVGMARDGLEAQELARSLRPDVMLMDVHMPRCDGIAATQRIKAELPEMKIVMLTVSAQDETLFRALESGASGYLLKNLSGEAFFDLLAELVRGEIVLAPGLAVKVMAEFAQRGEAGGTAKDADPASLAEACLSKLTPRQVEILRLVAQGLTYKEVGAALHLSEQTVKYHMGQVLARLHLQNRREAVKFARRSGLDVLA